MQPPPQAGLYTPPHELEAARAVLDGAVWVPPTVRPFYRDYPLLGPGSGGAALSAGDLVQQVQGEASARSHVGALESLASALHMGIGGEHSAVGSEPLHHPGGSVGAEGSQQGVLEDGYHHPHGHQHHHAADGEGSVTSASASHAELGHGHLGEQEHGEADRAGQGLGPQDGLAAAGPSSPGGGSEGGMDISFSAGMAGGPAVPSGLTGTELEVVREEGEEGEGADGSSSDAMHAHSSQQQATASGPGSGAGEGVDMEALLVTAGEGTSPGSPRLHVAEGSGSVGPAGLHAAGGSGAYSLPASGQPSTQALTSPPLPLPHLPAPSLLSRAHPTPVEAARAGAAALLQEVLREVLDPELDPEVFEALGCLPPWPLPPFAQLQSGGVEPLVLRGGALEAEARAAETAAAEKAAWLREHGGRGQEGEEGGEAGQEGVGEPEPESFWHTIHPVEESQWEEGAQGGPHAERSAGAASGGSPGAGEGGGSGGVLPGLPSSIEQVLQDPQFLQFAEYVLDSALYGLLQESAAGEWESPAGA